LDGKEIHRFPTPVEMTLDMYVLIDLARNRYGERDKASGLYNLEIDYIRVYQNPDFAEGNSLTFEAEALASTQSDRVVHFTDNYASGGVAEKLEANANGDHVTYTLPNIPTGRYKISVGSKYHSSRGRAQLKVDGVPQG